jgi:phosphoketolase
MAGAKLHPGVLFPVTIGDGGLGEPYIMSSFGHFHTAYPKVTNFLPILVWNGYSQEHHSMVSTKPNAEMIEYWEGNGFKEVILVNAKDFDDSNQQGDYVDSTQFSFEQRMAFMQAVLEATDKAAKSALNGTLTVLIVKQLKGAGVHKRGAQSHNLIPRRHPRTGLYRQSAPRKGFIPEAWQLVRTNCENAAGGPASHHVVTEKVLPLPDLGKLPLTEFTCKGDKKVATTAMGDLVVHVGKKDPNFVVTNADGNAASGINNINVGLKIVHPTIDEIYYQQPDGQVYEPFKRRCLCRFSRSFNLIWRENFMVFL